MKNKFIIIILFILVTLFILIFNTSFLFNSNIKVIKKMSSTTREDELNSKLTELNTSSTDYATYVQSCKAKLASAITEEGIATSENDTIDTIVNNIKDIIASKSFDIEVSHHHGLSTSGSNVGRETYWGTIVNTKNFNNLKVNLNMSAQYYSYKKNLTYTNANVILHIYAYTSDTDYIDLYGKKATSLNKEFDISNYVKIHFYIKFDETASDYYIDNTYGIQLNRSDVSGTLNFS